MPIQTDLNVSPYYDDYNANNSYHRILFKPAVAVQARELNQTQSILQDQIEKFGDSIYYHGSVIKAGEHFFDQSLYSVKLANTYPNGTIIDSTTIANTEGLYAVGQTTNNVNKVSAYVLKSAIQNNYVLLYKSASGSGQPPQFLDDETINFSKVDGKINRSYLYKPDNIFNIFNPSGRLLSGLS